MVASAVFVSVLTGSMVNVILPLMRAEFGVSAAQVGWVPGFALAYAVSVLLYGRISTSSGSGACSLWGSSGSPQAASSALWPRTCRCWYSRIVQAAGEPRCPRLRPSPWRSAAAGQTGRRYLVASSVGIGAAVGPIIGGVFGQLLGWRALFAEPQDWS